MSTREQYRSILASLAEKTKAKLPQLHGRVDKACRLVLAGDVDVHEDGSSLVDSLSDPARRYLLKDGVCQCRDWQQAPEHLCCHRLAAGFVRKLQELMPETPADETRPLFASPASVNCLVMLEGRQAQLTLRDHDEGRLLVRLKAVLKRYPALPPRPQGRSGLSKGERPG